MILMVYRLFEVSKQEDLEPITSSTRKNGDFEKERLNSSIVNASLAVTETEEKIFGFETRVSHTFRVTDHPKKDIW